MKNEKKIKKAPSSMKEQVKSSIDFAKFMIDRGYEYDRRELSSIKEKVIDECMDYVKDWDEIPEWDIPLADKHDIVEFLDNEFSNEVKELLKMEKEMMKEKEKAGKLKYNQKRIWGME